MATKSKGSSQPKRGFAFDLNKPLFKGNLLKQGEFHRAFKDRFFVLYPGFLVYYDDISTWKYDLQRGETLGGRLNAVKLKGGSVEKPKNHPRGAKYAFLLHAPDLSNKRYDILFNARSGEERYQWMVKLERAITGKDGPSTTTVSTDEPKKTEELKKPIEETRSPINNSSALSTDGSRGDDETVKKEDTKPVVEEAVNENQSDDSSKDANLDSELGSRDNPSSVSSTGSSGIELTDSSPEHSPPRTSPDNNSETSVVSSASVEVKNDQQHTKGDIIINKAPPPLLKRESTHRVMESSETVVHQPIGQKLSITIINGTDDGEVFNQQNSDDEEYSDEDSDGVELPVTPLPTKKEMSVQKSQEEDDNEDKEISPKPSASSDTSNTIVLKSGSTTSQPTPQISIDEVVDERQPDSSGKSSPNPGVIKKDEFSPASPTPDRRRPTGVAGFIEKRGYLYKQGGKHKSWHLRYFVLQPGMFTYYKNDPKGKVLGEVKLSKRVKIQLPKPGEKKYSSYQFTIYSPSDWNKRSTYTISANNDHEMKDWIEAFKLASGLLIENSISSK